MVSTCLWFVKKCQIILTKLVEHVVTAQRLEEMYCKLKDEII